MSQRNVKILKGAVYVLTFLVMALGLALEPTKGLPLDVETVFNIPTVTWVVLFVSSAALVFYQTAFNQKWNIISFTPILMYTATLFSLRFVHLNDAPIATVSVHMALASVILIDIFAEGADIWRHP